MIEKVDLHSTEQVVAALDVDQGGAILADVKAIIADKQLAPETREVIAALAYDILRAFLIQTVGEDEARSLLATYEPLQTQIQ